MPGAPREERPEQEGRRNDGSTIRGPLEPCATANRSGGSDVIEPWQVQAGH